MHKTSMTFFQAWFKYVVVMRIVSIFVVREGECKESSSSGSSRSLYSFRRHLHAAGLSSCRRFIFFPSHSHQSKPITAQTADST